MELIVVCTDIKLRYIGTAPTKLTTDVSLIREINFISQSRQNIFTARQLEPRAHTCPETQSDCPYFFFFFSPGQMEAGRAVGLSFGASMTKIVIPQAVKNILPTLGNEFISLIKETSVVSFVGAADLYVAFNYIGTNNYEFMVPYLVMALIYIVIVLIITLLIRLLERSLRKSDRRN